MSSEAIRPSTLDGIKRLAKSLPTSSGAYRLLTVLPIGNRRVEIEVYRALPVGLTAGTAAR